MCVDIQYINDTHIWFSDNWSLEFDMERANDIFPMLMHLSDNIIFSQATNVLCHYSDIESLNDNFPIRKYLNANDMFSHAIL